MAGVFTALFVFFLLGFVYLFKSYRSKKKFNLFHKILLGLFAFGVFVLLYKFAVEELYHCVAFGGNYCNFSASSYHSPLFPF